jgi:hypothetical protein
MLKIRFPQRVIVLFLLCLVVTMLLSVGSASANVPSSDVTIFPWDSLVNASPAISVNNPSNCTNYYGDASLNFTITSSKGWYSNVQSLENVGYFLDGKSYGPFNANSNLNSPFDYYINLTSGQGSHFLQVYFNYAGLDDSIIAGPIELTTEGHSDTVVFTVLPAVPTLAVQPLEINGTALNLNFTVNEPVSMLTYSLDNNGNVTIAGNTTLTNLPYGLNNITVYATNPAGNVGASQTVSFTLIKPEPSPTIMVMVVVSTIAVIVGVSIGLVVYRKKPKR